MRVTASVLRVRSGPGTNFRILKGLERDSVVEVKETHGDWAWVVPGLGWVSRAHLAAPVLVTAPSGRAAIEKMFGPRGATPCSAGRVHLPAPLRVGHSKSGLLISILACHVKMESLFTLVFHEIYAEGNWQLIRTYDGIYNNRDKTAQPGEPSTHSWGIAVDLNAATNRFGTKGDMPEALIRTFEKHGFRHLKNDPMHFQFAKGY